MWLFLAFITVPIIEIALFIQVGGTIGLWPTLGIVVVTAILGTWLVRTQGAMALGNLRRSFSELDDPTEPLAHGAMILLAGALLLTPGFFTDAIGFALLTPPVRRAAFGYLRKRMHVQRFEMGSPGSAHQNRAHHNHDKSDVIEGEFKEIDPHKSETHSTSGWSKH